MKGLIELHNLDKFLEDSSLSFNFRDLQKLSISGFGPIFHGICTKTFPVIQCKVMHDICGGF